jgi:hypothetical protein
MTEIQRTDRKSCKAKKPDGSDCQNIALPGSEFCFFHDPDKADKRREAQALGGRHNHIKTLDADAPDVKIESCSDTVPLLSETINQVRKGEIDPRVANAVGYLANVLIKAVEQSDIEKRLEAIEGIVRTNRPSSELTIEGFDK